jgi:triosephosphate isomerase
MKTVIGNWKMNGLAAHVREAEAILAEFIKQGLEVDVAVCPPATLVSRMAHALADQPLRVGAQTCHTGRAGAHTGDVSAEMLADAGAKLVLAGHSERRADHHETNGCIRAQAFAGLEAGLEVVVCLGESLAEHRAGDTLRVVEFQLSHSVPAGHSGFAVGRVTIAYEPVWAIGSGLTPTCAGIAEVHAHIKAVARRLTGPSAPEVRVLYGGSVKPDNAAEILATPGVDGALVGGASLTVRDFLPILQAAHAAGLASRG